MRTICMGTLLACLTAWLGSNALAEDFRIETKVYSGKSKTPASQNLTLFHAGNVYDYLTDPERVAVFDPAHGRFILLDPGRKVKTEIKTDEVLELATKLRELAASKSKNAFMKFAADPDFKVDFSPNGELSLTSDHMTYRLQTVPADTSEAAGQYREFSDWYARFNAMIHPGTTPPFPRLVANAELAERGLLPTEVHLTIPAQSGLNGRAVSMRSEHHISWRLLQRDHERVTETGNQLATFKTVDLREFEPPR